MQSANDGNTGPAGFGAGPAGFGAGPAGFGAGPAQRPAPTGSALRSFYQTLRDTGIDYYFQKKTTTDTEAQPAILQSHRPIVCAGCLIILEQDPKQYTASQTKILEGMLKVLDLGKEDYCVGWMRRDRADTRLSRAGTRLTTADTYLSRADTYLSRAGTRLTTADTYLSRAGTETGPYRDNHFIQSAILKYAPYSVLFLGSAFEKITIDDIPIAYTYSPQELEADPKLKRSAFDTLLNLKKDVALLGSPVGAGLCAGPVPVPLPHATRVP